MSVLSYLSLGSNLGDREQSLRLAIRNLAAIGRVVSISNLYETEPVEVTDQPPFLNQALALETKKSAGELMRMILEIECEMGRVRTRHKGPRSIDIDILLYGNAVIDSPELTIPHPAMQHRLFVLQPLVEIATEAWHPVLKRTVRELLDALPHGQKVKRLENSEPRLGKVHE